jgi:hypothetical protein
MNTKVCKKCGKEKPIERFRKRKDSKDGFRSECKDCFNLYFRQYFSSKEKMDKQAARVKKNKEVYRWRFSEYKLERGCEKCGYNKCARALHFHHINPKTKKFTISKAATRSMSKENIEKELKKCILLCANCHFELEHNNWKDDQTRQKEIEKIYKQKEDREQKKLNPKPKQPKPKKKLI